MAILEEDPVPILHALLDECHRRFFLPLTQALLEQLLAEVAFLGVAQNFLIWVSSLAEHKDYRRDSVSGAEEDVHGGERTDGIDLAKITGDIFFESLEQLLRLQKLDEQQSLKVGDVLTKKVW